jgi:hypothetical protein
LHEGVKYVTFEIHGVPNISKMGTIKTVYS